MGGIPWTGCRFPSSSFSFSSLIPHPRTHTPHAFLRAPFTLSFPAAYSFHCVHPETAFTGDVSPVSTRCTGCPDAPSLAYSHQITGSPLKGTLPYNTQTIGCIRIGKSIPPTDGNFGLCASITSGFAFGVFRPAQYYARSTA